MDCSIGEFPSQAQGSQLQQTLDGY